MRAVTWETTFSTFRALWYYKNMKEDQEISSWGGARPGAGRPAGTPNKAGRELREAASRHTDEALGVLVQLMSDPEQPGCVRVAAAQAVLDRGHGRPSQSIETRIELERGDISRLMVFSRLAAPSPPMARSCSRRTTWLVTLPIRSCAVATPKTCRCTSAARCKP